ncbi:MAG: hypothetical protein GWN00_31795 [Aliifodinibius sp.]|nr:hypothetical protein [Fodinibius sp.]NIV15335.1 hypothetical protein [Fodinibius sp.]NIY29204.1 hypothetical protein [Fodinibius sp.]
MPSLKKIFLPITLLTFFLTISCEQNQEPQNRQLPLDVKWVRQSVEYQAICLQTYHAAWQLVKSRAANLQNEWAVVLDVDETTLDNSRYQEILFDKNISFPEYWNQWVKREECPPIPGVKSFIDSVRTLGGQAHVVYITNRDTALEEATRNNLKKADLWREGDVLLCRRDKQDTKEVRRQEVITGTGRLEGQGKRTIIALIGDQVNDMDSYPADATIEELRSRYAKSTKWGIEYFMLPNPMYGYWVNNYK